MADPYADFYDEEESYYQQPRTQAQGLITPSIKLRPYTPDTSWLSNAGRALQGYQMPVRSRSDFYTNMLTRMAGNFMNQMGRQDEEEQTRGAYQRLAGILSGPDVGSRIASDPDFYDVAPSILLDEYKRKGKLADSTALQEMMTREGQRRKFFDVDPETHATSYFPGYIDALSSGERDVGFAGSYGKEAGKLSAQGELGEVARIAMHGADDGAGTGRGGGGTVDIIPIAPPPGLEPESVAGVPLPEKEYTWEGKYPTIEQIKAQSFENLAKNVRAQGGKVTTETQKGAESTVAPFRAAIKEEEKKIQDEYVQAQKGLDAIQRMRGAVQGAGYTGSYMGIPQTYLHEASRLLGAVSPGAKKKAEETDILESGSTELSRSLRTPGEGVMQKSDEIAFKSMVAGKDYNVATNKKLIEQKGAAFERRLEYVKFRDTMNRRGYAPDVTRALWGDFIKKNPLYTRTEDGFKVNRDNISPEKYFRVEKPIPVPGEVDDDMKRIPGESYEHWQTRTGG